MFHKIGFYQHELWFSQRTCISCSSLGEPQWKVAVLMRTSVRFSGRTDFMEQPAGIVLFGGERVNVFMCYFPQKVHPLPGKLIWIFFWNCLLSPELTWQTAWPWRSCSSSWCWGSLAWRRPSWRAGGRRWGTLSSYHITVETAYKVTGYKVKSLIK